MKTPIKLLSASEVFYEEQTLQRSLSFRAKLSAPASNYILCTEIAGF